MTLTTTSQTTEFACGTREAAGACVDVLREIVAGLDPDGMLAAEAPEVWSLFNAGEKLCAAAKTMVARKVDESGAWKEAGMRSAAEYLALRGGTTRDAARDALKTSERLRDLPQVEDAMRRGELSGAQAHLIADAASHDPTVQSALVDHAKAASLKELKDECLRRKAAADPKPEDTRDRIYKERYFRLSTDPEGAWRFSGRGPLDHAGIFGATLNPLIDDEFQKARAEGKREERGALAYDALQEMARLARARYYGDDLPEDDTAEHPDTGADDTSAGERATDDRPTPAGNHDTSNPGTRAADAGSGSADSENTTRNAEGNEDSRGACSSHDEVGRPGRPGTSTCQSDAGAVGDPAAAPNPAAEESSGPGPFDGFQPALPGHSDPGNGTTGPRRRKRGTSRKNRRKRRKRTNPSHLAILRLDVEALRRGYTQGDELCEIAGVGPVSVDAARGLLGDSIVKLVLTKGTAVASVVHLGRGSNVAQRTALLWAQPECSVEGCCHTFSQVDHRQNWHLIHETTLDNLDRLCTHHHRLKTYEGWALVAGTGKRAMVPPDDPRHPTAPTGKEDQHPPAQAA